MTAVPVVEVTESDDSADVRSGPSRVVVIVLAVALAAVSVVAVWLALERSRRDVSGPVGWSEATPAVVAMIDENLEAYNSGDWDAYAATFTEDSVFREIGTGGSGGIEGRDQIVRAMTTLQGFGARYERVGDILQIGNVVVFPVSDGSSLDATEIDVAMFDDDMKITEYVTIVAG